VRLPDPQHSHAVLIGTSTYRSPELADLPAVRNNLNGLAGVLTDPTLGGLPTERCITLPDPTDARTVYRTLHQYATRTTDTLLVYFAGQGRIALRNELYLGLTDTDPNELRVSALPFDLIREVLADSPAANRILILDCCFRGLAIPDLSGPDQAILGQVGIEGTYTLTATPATAVALAPTYTAFTGELLTLLRTGIPDGPELITFATLYRHLLHTLTTRGLPRPAQHNTGTVDQLALTHNPAHHPHHTAVAPSQRSGASPRGAHTDATINHDIQSGQGIQDGLYAQGKKTLYAALTLIILLVSIGLAVNVWLIASRGSGYVTSPWPVILVILGFILVYILGQDALPMMINVMVLFRPFNLRINTRGIELKIAGRSTLYHWRDISKVTVRRIQPDVAKLGIYVYPVPSVPTPKIYDWSLLSFPKLDEETGWILVAPVRRFKASHVEIETALARFAGSRWDPDE
jgi:hypothetical protein